LMVKPFIIGTRNARDMLHIGVEILRNGGSAMDAVEAAVNLVEENTEDMSVGVGGIPNMIGVIQLDASIMDGKTLNTGAVASVEGYSNPISIARKVMEVSPHVLLVGSGAELFAKVMGFEERDISTESSRGLYDIFVRDAFGEIENERRRQYIESYVRDNKIRDWYDKISKEYHGTVNVMAMDANGNICSGVSTSGLALKLPGRVGDSPIIGAGNYCDNRVGAAACTGMGELAIRLSTARTIIGYMENGWNLREACTQAMKDIFTISPGGGMNCLAIDRDGNTMSASTDGESIHYYMDIDSAEPEERKGIWVKP